MTRFRVRAGELGRPIPAPPRRLTSPCTRVFERVDRGIHRFVPAEGICWAAHALGAVPPLTGRSAGYSSWVSAVSTSRATFSRSRAWK